MKTKKELNTEYKQMKTPMGVFQVRNIIDNKVMLDSSVDMVSKWNRHKMELKFGKHRNRTLQQDWNEKGEDKFVFEIVSELKYKDDEIVNYQKELLVLQEMIVDELNSKEDLY